MSSIQPDVKSIHESSKTGFAHLLLRTIIINGLRVASVYFLSLWLEPTQYGEFAVLNYWIGAALFFTDFGMGGALTQKKEDPSREELHTTTLLNFTQAIVIFLIFWFAAPYAANAYNLGDRGISMLRVLASSIPIYTIRYMPEMLLRRKLQFRNLAKVEVIETSLLYLVQIVLAKLGYGTWSFIIAILARNICGTFLVYRFNPYFPSLTLKFQAIKPHLKYAFTFQLSSIIGSLKGLVFPIVVLKNLSTHDAGLITWTVGISSIPISIVMIYNQIFFPSLSLLQENKDSFKHLATRGLEVTSLFLIYIAFAIMCCSKAGIEFAFKEVWLKSLPIFPLACFLVSLTMLRFLNESILNSTGKTMNRMTIEIFYLLLNFSSIYYFTSHFGIRGYFYGAILTEFLALLLTLIVTREYFESRVFTKWVFLYGVGFLNFQIFRTYFLNLHLFLQMLLYQITFLLPLFLLHRGIFRDFKWLIKESHSLLTRKIQNRRA